MTTITAAININGAGEIESSASSTAQHHQHITAERIGVGHYRINHVVDLASEGWRTSIPRDDNGQLMFTIETLAENEQLNVLVFEQEALSDIPAGRVLTLRMDATDPPAQPEDEEPLEEAQS